MSSASNSAGVVGKWGQTSFTAVSAKPPPLSTTTAMAATPPAKKFFTSRNIVASAASSSSSLLAPPPFPSSSGRPSLSTTSKSKGAGNVHVAIRVRPPLDRQGVGESVVEVNEFEGEIFVNLGKTFKFDHVLGQDSTQDAVYRSTVQPLLRSFLGSSDKQQQQSLRFAPPPNAAVLAYGPTGTGKTWTMGTHYKLQKQVSSPDDFGIIPRVVEELFQIIGSDSCTVKVSFFEILNEKIHDLVNPNRIKVPLRLKEEGHEFAVVDLSSHIVNCKEDALKYLEQGALTRSTGATAQNEMSSRSHAVFRITVLKDSIARRLSLVDLAGSESAGANTDAGRRKEGININMGLSALGRCIHAICQAESHVPFRDSILTKVLRECFVGGGLTTMITCVSPLEEDLAETISSLRYADNVKMMEKPTLPKHLLQLVDVNQSAQKRRNQMIPPTPASNRKRLNNTIDTPTPTKKISRPDIPRMNSSLDTPSQAAASNFAFPSFASKMPSLETIADEDSFGNFSDIQSNHSFASSSKSMQNSSIYADMTEVKSLLSPMLRRFGEQMLENVGKQLENAVQKMHTERKATRMTSSPRRSPRLTAKSDNKENLVDDTILSGPEFTAVRKIMRQQQEQEDSLEQDTASHTFIESCVDSAAAAQIRTPKVLCDITNQRKRNHLRQVEETASPDLMRKSIGKVNRTPPRPSEEEMAKSLGIDINSPGLLFTGKKRSSLQVAPGSSVKRSIRRTTMMRPEIDQTRHEMKEDNRRRSVRIINQGNNPVTICDSVLEEKNHWRIMNQQAHNDMILKTLNTANAAMLQRYPGIGPKTAITLARYRDLNHGFASLEELKEVRGLAKHFFSRFCEKNQIQLDR